jgi:hypothetical protein
MHTLTEMLDLYHFQLWQNNLMLQELKQEKRVLELENETWLKKENDDDS